MPLVITLMAAPGDHQTVTEAVRRLVPPLQTRGLEPDLIVPLSEDSVDLPVETEDAAAVRDVIAERIADLPLDHAVQDVATRRKKLLLSDMDSTMIAEECLDEIADAAGIGDQVKPITARAMRGELDFEAALRERVALLTDKPWSLVDSALAKIRYSPGAEIAVRTLAAHGVHTILISGGFTAFTGPVSAALGFHDHESNTLGRDGDRIAGTVEGAIVTKDRKLSLLQEEIAARGLSPAETMAIGDGANDIPMLQGSGLGIGWRPKPAVADAADTVIAHADMRALCYLMGIGADRHATVQYP